jgi:hypothetical protein
MDNRVIKKLVIIDLSNVLIRSLHKDPLNILKKTLDFLVKEKIKKRKKIEKEEQKTTVMIAKTKSFELAEIKDQKKLIKEKINFKYFNQNNFTNFSEFLNQFKMEHQQKIMERLKTSITFYYKKDNNKKKYSDLFEILDNLSKEDIDKLNKSYDVKFVIFEEENNVFDKDLLKIVGQNIGIENDIFYFKELSKNLTNKDFYVVSNRIDFIQRKVKKQFNDFDFENNFIFFFNFHSDMKNEQYRDIFDELKIKWELGFLKNLENKLEIIEGIKKGNLQEDKLIFIGIDLSISIIYNEKKQQYFKDSFPLVFCNFNLFTIRKNICILMTKIKKSFFRNHKINNTCIKKSFKNLNKYLAELEKQAVHKILYSNFLKNYQIYYDRYASFDFFNTVLKNPEFRERFNSEFPGIRIRYPATILVQKIKFKEIIQKIKESKLKYPLIIKTKLSPKDLNPFGHQMMIVKNEEALRNLFENKLFEISKMDDLIIQEIYSSSRKILKLYNIFENTIIDLSNPLDLNSYGELEKVDAFVTLKQITDCGKEDVKNYKKIFKYFHSELKKYGMVNYGIDVVVDEKEENFFIIDLNPDTFSWTRFTDKETFLPKFRKDIIKCFEEINC